jgi:predicted ferric reductase
LAIARRIHLPNGLRDRFVRSSLEMGFTAGALLVAVMWLKHGALDAVTSPSGAMVAAGEAFALFGTYLALVGVLLVARVPFIEHILGDLATAYHRRFGWVAVAMIVAHVILSVGGFALAGGASFVDEFANEIVTLPYMLAALVALVLFVGIGMSSMPWIRRHLSYETWTGIHLYAYLAILLGFGHQLAVGSDFANHQQAAAIWSLGYVVVFGIVIRYRIVRPVAMLLHHRFRVERVVVETSSVVSLHVAGSRLAGVRAQAGQYFRIRLLARNEWWRSHPFSLSAVPDGESLRFTIKALGDFSTRLQELRPGTRLMLEGPYGAMTEDRVTSNGVVLIGGGIGVTLVRALFEQLAGRVDVKLLYRVSHAEDVVFWEEITALARRPRAAVMWLIGRRGSSALPRDPLGKESLRRLVPDIHARDIFLCGPRSMMDSIEQNLRELGVPPARIHFERFA